MRRRGFLYHDSSKYNYMFESMLVQKRALLRKMPDIQQAVEVVSFLRRRKEGSEPTLAHFPLTDNCYGSAVVPPTDTVCLWLGANVMLEYSISEAESLLRSSSDSAYETMRKLDENLAFIRDQITTTEVNNARVHNFMANIKAQLRAIETGGEMTSS
jgi:prefoldin subunit 5